MNRTTLLVLLAVGMVCAVFGSCVLLVGITWFFHSAPPEGQMEMTLPAVRVDKNDVSPEAIADEIAPAAPLIVIVTVNDDGKAAGTMQSIVLETPEGKKTIPMGDWRRGLSDELKKARAKLDGEPAVKIQAGRRLKWAYVVEILDTCKLAGLTNVGFAPPPDE